MSSPRLNSVAKRAQRAMVAARRRAIDASLGREVRCGTCGEMFTTTKAGYRGIAVRDRVAVEAVRYACDHCGAEIAVIVESDPGPKRLICHDQKETEWL
jgi:predicted SprT family Zn-dependent metalloprotease